MQAIVERNLRRLPPEAYSPGPSRSAYWIHTFPLGGVALHYANRRPGPRLSPPPSGEAGAQPRFSRQLQRSVPFFTGCGGGANVAIVSVRRVSRGIGSQGWVPAFAGTTGWGRRPAQQGQQARRRQAEMRSVHAAARPAGGEHDRTHPVTGPASSVPV